MNGSKGGYRCACHPGFQMGDVECEDINECKNNPCKNGNCTNLEGSYECVCQNGFQIKLDKNFCEDVNECLYDNGGCDHLCSNIEGSRICSCRDGYQGAVHVLNLLDNRASQQRFSTGFLKRISHQGFSTGFLSRVSQHIFSTGFSHQCLSLGLLTGL